MAKCLTSEVFGNPHSHASDMKYVLYDIEIYHRIYADAFPFNIFIHFHRQGSTAMIAAARAQVLAFFNTSAKTHAVIFTAGATAAIKLVGECFPWQHPNSHFAYARCSHTSIVGVREFLNRQQLRVEAGYSSDGKNLSPGLSDRASACRFSALSRLELRSLCRTGGDLPRETGSQLHPTSTTCGGISLLALPGECNFSGEKYDLSMISSLQNKHDGSQRKWRVLLDAAKLAATSPVDLGDMEGAGAADYVAVSFYKICGLPTGLGALIMRIDNGAADLLCKGRQYFGGATPPDPT